MCGLVGRSQVFSNNQSMDLMVSEDRPYADPTKVRTLLPLWW